MNYALSAATRTSVGRRAKDELAKSRVPAVIYGAGTTPRVISVPRSEFLKVLAAAGQSSLVDVTIESDASVKAIIKEVQVHPLTMTPIHIDFLQVNMKEKMVVSVPLKLVGESAAVKVLGGSLSQSLDEVEVRCLPADLPHELELSIESLATFEDSLSVSDIKAPQGVEIVTDPEIAIASVSRPLTEDELKAMEAAPVVDITAIKSDADIKKAAAEAKKAEEEAAKK